MSILVVSKEFGVLTEVHLFRYLNQVPLPRLDPVV